ncbi:hypothetical protein FGL75_09615 (plasmid) [Weissella hellenica]|uniref:hypothetical protein n=1 Tax=Weissella sagaensis TaxID=2559928 RepID=UPI0005A778D2|nr:hypothetical protein [Weissella sagaensis]QEA58152.1 hypothetical protein FGL75_09615 [Weissella hellenica]
MTNDSIWHEQLAKFFNYKRFKIFDIEAEFDDRVNEGLEPKTALMLVTQDYLKLKLSSYNVPVVEYQQLFRERYTEAKFDYDHVLAWAKLVNEFGIEPANAHWDSLMPILLDDMLE